METKWNDQEDAALRGLSMLAQLIYLRVFRRHMDYATGMTGLTYRIDYQTICDAVSFIPDPGSQVHRWIPTKEKVRAAIKELERVLPDMGREFPLLIEAGSGPHRGYLKKLPLALLDTSVQKGNPTGTPHEPRKTNPTTNSTERDAKNKEYQIDGDDEQRNEPRSEKTCCTAMNAPPPVSGRPEDRRRDKSLVEFAAGDPDDGVPPASPTAKIHAHPVREIFDYWQRVMAHPRAILNNKRQRVITARLREGYRVPDIKRAIDGCKQSAWHQGKNPDHKVFDDIELICRDGSKLEQFQARLAEQCQQDQTLDDWLHEDERGVGDFIDGECRHV